jgi:hypothetical protein
MEESKSHEDKEAHKIASLESGAGGDVGSARRIGPQQGGGKPQPAAEGCVMFRAWSRDAWVFVSGKNQDLSITSLFYLPLLMFTCSSMQFCALS